MTSFFRYHKDMLLIFLCKESLSFRATLSNIIDEIMISRICFERLEKGICVCADTERENTNVANINIW